MGSWDASGTAAVISAAIALLAWLASLLQLLISRRYREKDAVTASQKMLAACEQEYASVVQPALATLADFKWQYPDGALWTALLAPRRVHFNAADGLQEPHGASLQEHRARNATKDFWKRLIRAMEDGQLPTSFGSADCGGAIRFSNDHDGATWRERANNFRLLVEPFDIANYYRMGLHNTPSGHYLTSDNRPAIFKRLEDMTVRHLRAQPATAALLTYTNSMVWAHAQAGTVPGGSGWAPLAGGPQAHPPLRDAPVP